MQFKKTFALLSLGLILGAFAPKLALANLGSDSALDDLAVQVNGDAQYDSNGDLFISASSAGSQPFGSTYLYNTSTHEVVNSPLFLGEISASTPDGTTGFYVYGDFGFYQSQTDTDIGSSVSAQNLAHVSADGEISDVVPLVTNGSVSQMLYVEMHDALFIAGDFTTVNGAPHQGLACVDPSTGDFCVIGLYDWSDNVGFLSGDQLSLSHDATQDRLLVGGQLSQYTAEDVDTVITVLDPANPTANLGSDYLDEDVSIFDNPLRPTVQVLYFDSQEDLDGNEVTEKYVYLYTSPIIRIFVDNGAGYVSNTEISTFGFQEASLTFQDNDRLNIAIASVEDFSEAWQVSLSPITTAYNPLFGGSFNFTLHIGTIAKPLADSGLDSTLTAAVINSSGDTYFAGSFDYENGPSNDLHNFVGVHSDETLVYSGLPMSRDIQTVSINGDLIFLGGSFQASEADYINRSILKIDGENGTVDESFNLRFLNFRDEPVPVTHFYIQGNYLYVYETGDTVTGVQNITTGVVTPVPALNLFRINLLTNTLDEDFFASLEGDPEFTSVQGNGVLLYCMTNTGILILNEDGTLNSDAQTNYDDSTITFDSYITSVMGEDGSLYWVADVDTASQIFAMDSEGNARVIYTELLSNDVNQIYQYGLFLIVAYQAEDSVIFQTLDLNDGVGMASSSPVLDYGIYSLTGGARVYSFVHANDILYAVGVFDTLYNGVTESASDVVNVIGFDDSTGENVDVSSLLSVYRDLNEEGTALQAVANPAGDQVAFFGLYSFQYFGHEESLVASPFGLLFLPSGDPEVLTEVTPIPSRVRVSDAVYYFANSGEGVTVGAYYVDCGEGADPSPAINIDDLSMHFTDLTVGETYECHLSFRSEFGFTNELTAGPFTVISDATPTSGVILPPQGATVHAPLEFTDLEGEWSKPYVEVLKDECGVTGYLDAEGDPLGLYGPQNPITRAELVKILVSCTGDPLPITGPLAFNDLDADAWYLPYLAYAKEHNWVQGYADGSFHPNESITRAEAIKIILLSRYSSSSIVGGTLNFSDVDSSSWYAKYLAYMTSKDFVHGYFTKDGMPTGLFGPQDFLTRGEAAKMIVNVKGFSI